MNGNEVRKSGLPRGIGWGIAGLIAVFIVGSIFAFGSARDKTAERFAGNLEYFREGIEDLRNLNTDSAGKNFFRIGEEIAGLRDTAGFLGPFFGEAGEAFSEFQNVAAQGIVLSQEVEFLSANAFKLFLEDDGSILLERLKSARAALKSIEESGRKLASAVAAFDAATPLFAGESYLSLQVDLARIISFLDALIPKLENDGLRILVLLQNPAEMRPAGGFLGSYAEVFIKDGRLESVGVRDINGVDGAFDELIVPPRPLQAITTSWRPYDANWFFDFSLSADKVAEFFAASGPYEGRRPFDGIVAISPKVVEDILALTGPLEISERKLLFSADNFLTETQRVVQAGQASRATYPKQILEELAPLLFSLLAELEEPQISEFWSLAAGWAGGKDAMFYFKEPKLQSFARHYGATGEIYETPAGFIGDYLAIVDANINGGKSDLFMRQDVLLESQINLDGTVSNHLAIDRIHEGNKSQYWWYKETNQNYLQIFVPNSARLTNFKGGVDKKITPKINYVKEGYDVDSGVSAIESSEEIVFNYPSVRTHKESGKKVFSTWSATKAGAKTQISFDYVTRLSLAPADGTKYQFIFEKQAGTNRNYKFQINAPVGFRFQENGLPVYAYESVISATSTRVLPGRLVVDLTLEKI